MSHYANFIIAKPINDISEDIRNAKIILFFKEIIFLGCNKTDKHSIEKSYFLLWYKDNLQTYSIIKL